MQLSNFKTNFNLKNFIEAGILVDTETKKPSYNDHIYGIRFKHTVYDLRKSSLNLRKAMEYINTLCSKTISTGSVGFITVSENTPLLKTTSLLAKKSFQQGYTSYKWLGGFLSNWKTVVKKHIAMERRYKKNRSILAQIEKNICISKKGFNAKVNNNKLMLSTPLVVFMSNIDKELSKYTFIDSDILKNIFKSQFKVFKKNIVLLHNRYKFLITKNALSSIISSRKIFSLKTRLNNTCNNLVFYNKKCTYKKSKCSKLIVSYMSKYINQIKVELPKILKNEKTHEKKINKKIFYK